MFRCGWRQNGVGIRWSTIVSIEMLDHVRSIFIAYLSTQCHSSLKLQSLVIYAFAENFQLTITNSIISSWNLVYFDSNRT